jgi:protoporphyrinogen/coproporphyrinogen III oxidase
MAGGASRRRVAVIGGGIAGIAAAERLIAEGHRAEVFEAAGSLGGRMMVARLRDREACLGGKNVGRRYSAFRALAEREREREWEFFGPETMQVLGRRLVPMSFRKRWARVRLGARMAVRGQLPAARRFSRLAREVKQDEEAGFLGSEWFDALAREHGNPTLADYFGAGFCSTAVRHTTVRMNGAEPDEAWLANFGSNLALVVDTFDQLTHGIGPLLEDAHARGPVHLGARVDHLLVRDGRIEGVVADGGERHTNFDAAILALPAHAAASLVAALDAELAALLLGVRYQPAAVVVASYDRPLFRDAYAAIAASADRALSNAGSYGLNDRNVIRYTFSGRAARGRIAPATFDPERLLAEAEGYLSRYLPVREARLEDYVAHTFAPGLCAYRPDHPEFLARVRARVDALPGLALAGDYLRGASLEACTRSGWDAASVIARADLPTPVEAAPR